MKKATKHLGRFAALIIVGLAINVAGAKLALWLGLPLYLDSIGTVFAAALGGYIPGIVVGYLSNVINSIGNTITLYYGLVSVLMAAATSYMASKGCLRTFAGSLTLIPVLSLLGGGLGSVMTWLLYGFSIGEGISAQMAGWFWQNVGMPEFWAQLTADMLLDIVDKAITVTVMYLMLKYMPKSLREGLGAGDGQAVRSYRRHSLAVNMIAMVITTGVLTGALLVSVSLLLNHAKNQDMYARTASGAAELTSEVVTADFVDTYLGTEVADERYEDAMERLENIKAAFPEVKFIYVYKIMEDGCHVVIDVSTSDVEGSPLGSVMEFEESFTPYLDTLLEGGEIEPVISNDQFGYLLTVYRPIKDGGGRTAAYACVDVQMDEIITDEAEYAIRLVSLTFATLILVCLGTIWYADETMVEPINRMTAAAGRFAYESEEERVRAKQSFAELDIHTGNEIESLYGAVNKTVSDLSDYITKVNAQNRKISDMQFSIITMLADIVEKRDENTGEHIKRTAAYVGIIARRLQQQGDHPELTDSYIYDMAVAAPLHDVGKIHISDTILNKPGRLTPEEFAVMKTHAAEGRQILREAAESLGGFSYLTIAADMAGSHHEWWNGQGYPEGLSGEDIPLCARIMAVADVFDALISKRSYKEAMPMQEAYAVLERESGTHFDPVCVKAFLAAADEVEEVSGQ